MKIIKCEVHGDVPAVVIDMLLLRYTCKICHLENIVEIQTGEILNLQNELDEALAKIK